jgi:hypothetical protein
MLTRSKAQNFIIMDGGKCSSTSKFPKIHRFFSNTHFVALLAIFENSLAIREVRQKHSVT